MATATLTGDVITLDVPHRETHLAKQVPGARFHVRADEHSHQSHFTLPLSWASCVGLRGVFGPELKVDPELGKWAKNEIETRIQPALDLRNMLELPEDHRWAKQLGSEV